MLSLQFIPNPCYTNEIKIYYFSIQCKQQHPKQYPVPKNLNGKIVGILNQDKNSFQNQTNNGKLVYPSIEREREKRKTHLNIRKTFYSPAGGYLNCRNFIASKIKAHMRAKPRIHTHTPLTIIKKVIYKRLFPSKGNFFFFFASVYF